MTDLFCERGPSAGFDVLDGELPNFGEMGDAESYEDLDVLDEMIEEEFEGELGPKNEG